jgi:2-isopropylmalate synthase
VLKNRENYEIIDPVEVGAHESSIVLTARSGRAALKHRLHVLGYTFTTEELEDIYSRFLELADTKKDIGDEDLEFLMGNAEKQKESIKLELLQVVTGKDLRPVAIVKLEIGGKMYEASASGKGGIDAALNATMEILKRPMKIHEVLIQTFSRTSGEVGKVHIQLQWEGKIFYGFGSHDDLITAATEAFLDAVNKMAPVQITVPAIID